MALKYPMAKKWSTQFQEGNLIKAKIVGIGSYVPKKVLTNADLEKLVDTSDEWIKERTGILERRIASEKEITSDLAVKAAKKALIDAKIKGEDLELIILATLNPDRLFPATACSIQEKLSAHKAAAFDISATCSGFIYALSIAEQYIKNGTYKNVLIVASEILSRMVDWTDRGTCVLFGDAAAAVVLQPTVENDSGIFQISIRSDGRYADIITTPGGGSLYPPSHETVDKKLHFIQMKGNKTFKIAVQSMKEIAKNVIISSGYKINDIDLLICHQANKRIIDAVSDALSFPKDKVFVNIEKYGNTSAASIPLALDEAVKQGRLKKGESVLLVAFGGGLTCGATLLKL